MSSKTIAGAISILSAAILWPLLATRASAQSPSFDHAMQLFQGHQWADAAAEFDQCEKSQPGKTAALLYDGKSLLNLGRLDEAAAALHGFWQIHPQSEDVAYLLAYIRFRQNKPRESLQLYNEAVKLKGPTADDLKIVGLDYALLSDYTDAANYLEKSLSLDPANIEARYHLGRVRYQQNQFDLAIAAFQEVLRRDPGHIKAEDNLGLSLEGKNENEAAIAAYNKAIQLDEAQTLHNEQPYLNLGTLLAKTNRAKEAVSCLVRATTITSGNLKAHYQLAKVYFDLESFGDAQQEAEKAVNLDSGDSSSHYLLGRIYRHSGKSELAEEQFRITEELIRKKGTEGAGGTSAP